MAKQLAPLAPLTTPRNRPPASWQDGGVSHPFDTPFDLMKSMQTEIHHLKAAFKAEQQKHDAEVAGLRGDVLQLRTAFQKEQAERTADSKSLGDQLAREVSDRHTEVTELRAETVAALHLRAMDRDLETLKGRVLELEDMLQHEKQAWRDEVQTLTKSVDANSEGDNDFARQVFAELKELKELSDAHAQRHTQFATHIDQRVAAAAEIMITVGASYSKNSAPVSPVPPPYPITPQKGVYS